MNQKRTPPPAKQSTFIRWRFYLVCVGMLLAFSALVGRAAYIQVVEPGQLRKEGDLRSLRTKEIPTARGIISDRNGEQLAISVPVQAVWADPKRIAEKGLGDINRWHALADVLALDREEMLTRITANPKRRFIYLQRQVSPAMANYVSNLKLPGIGLQNESRRYYPSGEVSSQLIGVTGIDGRGLEGVERSYDSWLTGEAGTRTVRKDRYGRVVENISDKERQPGNPLQLSIDQRIQAVAYRAAKQAVADHQATSVSVIMTDVTSGEVLAMVNSPSYNPNNRNELQSFRMRNRTITDAMEPGSSVKPFVVLAALEAGIADEHTKIDTGNGIMQIGGSRVRDVSKAGVADLRRILQKSSNIGVTKLSLDMPIQELLGFYNAVGLGESSGIDLIGESQGIFPYRTRWSDFERATISFGYGLSVTPVQLVRAYTTLGGVGVARPLSVIKLDEKPEGVRVASEANTLKLLDMLESVTQRGGSATRAAVPGYRVGAKTGTSVKAVSGGYGDEYVALTAGLAPISSPRLALVVVVNEPQGDQYYGGLVAAPIFAEVMKSALQILNVPPDDNGNGINIVTTEGRSHADS
ncbi:penicillin-binding transpeptidase domain-containing protein [Thaumasiovibrio subtropicus]|uniref:penicillin-binding transpeptidase domain-containing protein n=1 Tax=Thaumasiovibrio subtropicus TaxID=1891207 RepID=UPI000B34D39F|nr:penicillin-binding transpeptidase domain-containing protein [Thaumasiovibrio subtropicus]